MSVNYHLVEQGIMDVLKADAAILAETDAGRPVWVTDEPDTPTLEQCPAVQVYVQGANREATRLAQGIRPSNEQVTVLVRCSAASAESVPDARRQRDALVALVLDALEATVDTRRLNGAVTSLQVGRVEFEPVERTTGLFARAVLTVTCLAQS